MYLLPHIAGNIMALFVYDVFFLAFGVIFFISIWEFMIYGLEQCHSEFFYSFLYKRVLEEQYSSCLVFVMPKKKKKL